MKKIFLFTALQFAVLLTFSQNIGVGTLSPLYKLHVHGDLFVNSGQGEILYGYPGADYKWHLSTINGGQDLMIRSENQTGLVTTRAYFQQNGNVSLGNTSPIAKLDVVSNSSSSATSNFMLRNGNGDTLLRMRDNGYMSIGYNGTSYGRPLNIQGSGANFYYDAATFAGAIFPDVNSNLILWTNNVGTGQNLVLQPSWGQVTIGTYSPATGYKLSVNGKAIFTEVRVQVNGSWPDYVFKKNYKLPMLGDLEKSINLNQHLPNIPAASEIEKNGIDLGDMNRRLLEKVEELTLYIIDMNKKITEQDNRIKELEKK